MYLFWWFAYIYVHMLVMMWYLALLSFGSDYQRLISHKYITRHSYTFVYMVLLCIFLLHIYVFCDVVPGL